MSCICCNNAFYLGCLQATKPLVFKANDIGYLILEFEFLGVTERLTASHDGTGYSFDVSEENEAYTFLGRLIKGDGSEAVITVDTVNYDCLKFITRQGAMLNLPKTITLT